MNNFLGAEMGEPDETRIFTVLHGDAAAMGFAQILCEDGFTVDEAIGLAIVASDQETEVAGMQFIDQLTRRNSSSKP